MYWIKHCRTPTAQASLGPENLLETLFCLPVHQDPSIYSSGQIVSDPGQPKAPEDHPVLFLILQLLAEVCFSHLARWQLYCWMNLGAVLVMLFLQKGLWLRSGNRKDPTPRHTLSKENCFVSYKHFAYTTCNSSIPTNRPVASLLQFLNQTPPITSQEKGR